MRPIRVAILAYLIALVAPGSSPAEGPATSHPEGKEIAVERGHFRAVEGDEAGIGSMALSPDGKRLLVAGPDVVLWDLEKRKRVMNLGRPGVLRVDLARSGRYAAAGCADGTVRVWDLESGKEVRALKGHTERVMEIRFFPEGNRIASASVDGTVRISDFLGEKVTVLKGDGSPLYAVDVSSDGALVDGGGGISVTNLMARFTSGTARQGG